MACCSALQGRGLVACKVCSTGLSPRKAGQGSRVGCASTYRDGEKALQQVGRGTDVLDAVLLANLFCDSLWGREDADAGLTKGFHQGAVVKLADDSQVEPLAFQPVEQGLAYGGVSTG